MKEGQTSLWGSLGATDRAATLAAGAIGEICAMTFTAAGTPVETPMSRRAIGIELDLLRACPEVICLAFGTAKAEAIAAAIRGGKIKTLVTHAAVAEALVLQAPVGAAGHVLIR